MKISIIISYAALLLSHFGFTQNHIVVDSLTNEPIPYSSIKFLKSPKGFYANEKGVFSLNEKSKDSLQISCLGYITIFKSTISLKDTIILVPEAIKLNEIILNDYKRKKEVLGLKRKKIKFYTNSNLQIGLLIKPTKEYIGKYIDNIEVPINKKLSNKTKGNEDFKSVFKVNIYSNERGLPKHPILEKPIDIFVTNKSKDLINIDLSDSLIEFTEDGIFVCLEMVGELDKNGEVKNIKNHRPSFVFTDRPLKEFSSESFYKVKFNNEWKPMSIDTFHLKKEIFLAIGLTISSYD